MKWEENGGGGDGLGGDFLKEAAGGQREGKRAKERGCMYCTFAGVVVDGDPAGCDVSRLRGVGDVAKDYAFGEAIADLESRHSGWIGWFRGYNRGGRELIELLKTGRYYCEVLLPKLEWRGSAKGRR